MIEVDIPGVGVVEFPDDMSEADLSNAVSGLVGSAQDPTTDYSRGRASSAGSSFMRTGGELFGGAIQGLGRLNQMLTGVPLGGDPVAADAARTRAADEAMSQGLPTERTQALAAQEQLAAAPITQFGANLQAGAREAYPVNPQFSQEFWAGTIPSGAGSLVSGALGGPLGIASLHGLSSGESAAQRAVEAGVPENAGTAFGLTAPIVGVSEGVLGMGGRLISGLTQPAGNIGRRMLVGATREGTQEGIEQTGQNIVEQQVINPSKRISDGVLESTAAGFLLGGGAGALQGVAAPRPAPELATDQAAQQAAQDEVLENLDALLAESEATPRRRAEAIDATILESGLSESTEEGESAIGIESLRRPQPASEAQALPQAAPIIRPTKGDLVSYEGYVGRLVEDESGRPVIETQEGLVEIGDASPEPVARVSEDRGISFGGETWKPRRRDWRESWLGGQFYVRNSKGERGVIEGEAARYVAKRMADLDAERDARYAPRRRSQRLGSEELAAGIGQLEQEPSDTPIDELTLQSGIQREAAQRTAQYASPSAEPRVVGPSGRIQDPSTQASARAYNQRAAEPAIRRSLVDAVESASQVPAQASAAQIDEMLGVGRPPVPLEAAQQTIFDQSWEAELQKALSRSGPKPGYWQRVQKWADHTIKESKKNVNTFNPLTGIDPTVGAAYAVKMADAVAKGAIKTFEAFKTEFLKRFPDAADYARDVWNRLSAKDSEIFKAIDEATGSGSLQEATKRFGGSVTSLAYRVGERTTTQTQIDRLSEGMEKATAKAREGAKRLSKVAPEEMSDLFNELSEIGMKGQFYREALEYATGTGSAGTWMRKQDPSWIPPMERGDRFLSVIDSQIEKLRPDRTRVMEGVLGSPVWLTKEAARLSLQAVRAAYVGTKSLAKAIDAGVKWMQDNGVKASAADMRSWLDSQLQPKRTTPEPTPAQPASTPQEAKTGEDVLKRVNRIFTKDPTPGKPLKQRLKEATENLRTGWSSKFRPLDRLAEDIGKKYGSAPKRIAHIFEAVRGATGKSEADIYRFDRDVARQVKGLEPEFNQYLFLARTLDRLRSDQREAAEADKARDEQVESGQRPDRVQTGPGRRRVSDFTIEDAQAGLRALGEKLGPEATQRMNLAAQSYQEHMDAALRRQVESGRMSQEIYDSIKSGNEFYAPFKLLKYLEVSAPVQGGGSDIDTTAEYTKAIKGINDADFRLGDIMTASRQNIALSRILSEKNLAMQQFAKVAAQDADGVFVERLKSDEKVPLDKGLVNVFQNGAVQRYATDPEVAAAVSGLHGKSNEAIGRILRAVATTFRAGVTTGNVAFQAVNLGLADIPRTALASRFGLKALNPADYLRYPVDIGRAMFSAMRPGMDGLYQDYLDSGAAGSTFQEFLSPKAFEPTSTQKKTLRNILDTPAKIARAFEESSKVLGVKRAMRDTGATSGADLAKRFPDAITEIRRFSGSPDFARMGSTVEAMKLNLLIMFFNARIQGTVADVGRLMGRDGKKDAARMWGRLGVFVGIPTAALWALNHAPGNEDDYEKRPQWEKDNYWLIPKENYIQSDSGEMVRDYWRIPKREAAKLIGNLTESSLRFADKRDPQAVMDFGVDLLENLSPLNIGGDTAQQKLESAASSLNPLFVAGIETGTGRSLFRHRNIVPDSMSDASPEQQYMERTPQMFRALAELMPDAAPEVLRSPLMLENLTRNFTGSLITQFVPDKPVAGREGYLSRTIGRRFHSAPYTDTGAERDEIQRLEREATDEYLKRHRIAIKAVESSPDFDNVIQAAIKEGGLDERLLEHTADMWMAERAGITGLDRKILSLPAKQRAIYIKTQMDRFGSDDAKLEYMTGLILKRILTDSVMEELATQE